MVEVKVNSTRLSGNSITNAILRGFEEVFAKLLNKAITGKTMVVNVLCMSRKKGNAQRRGKISVGAPSTNSLFVEYQHGDNGTCYEYRVIVPTIWMTPEELRQKLIQAQNQSVAKVKVLAVKPATSVPEPVLVMPPVLPAPVIVVPPQEIKKKKISLCGFTKDPQAIEILLIYLREIIAENGFVTRKEVVEKLIELTSGNKSSVSQAFRRIVEANILAKTEGGYKIPTESGSGGFNLTARVLELKGQLEKFEATAWTIKQAEKKISELSQRKADIEKEATKIGEEIERQKAALEEVRSQIAPGSALAKAREAFLEIQKVLK